MGTAGIFGMLLLALLAGTEVAYFTISSDGYVLTLDYLPDELKDIMKNDGFSFEMTFMNNSILWENKEKSGLFSIDHISLQSVETKLVFPENNYTDIPVIVCECILSAENRFNRVLFSLNARTTFINRKLVRPPEYDKILSFGDARSRSFYGFRWKTCSPLLEHNAGNVTVTCQFFDRFTRNYVTLWSSIFYETTGNYTIIGGVGQ